MLVGIKKDKFTGSTSSYIIQTPEGRRFEIKAGWTQVRVPTRDGTGQTKSAIFDMEQLFLNGRVRQCTTADEAFAALKLIRTMPECRETIRAISCIKRYLDSQREFRRDTVIAQMTELYGAEVAAVLSAGFRGKAFHFPGYFLRETGFASFVTSFLNNWPGTSLGVYKIPETKMQAVKACYVSKGSKCSEWFRKEIQRNEISEDRIGPIFEVIKWVESYK